MNCKDYITNTGIGDFYRYALTLLLAGISCFAFAQKEFSLEIKQTTPGDIISKLTYKKSFPSNADRNKEIQKVLFALYDNAYLTANIDSLSNINAEGKKDSTYTVAYINPGLPYKWATLKKGNVSEEVLSVIGFREKMYAGKPFYFKELKKVLEKTISYYEDNGYPFASIKLDSVQISDHVLSATLNLQKNMLIKIDSVVNHGKANITSVYLQSYLGIRNGDLYDESLIKQISTRIKELPFLKERIPFRVLFPGENAKVELFLEKKRASQFDGIVGLLPDNKTGKISLTGDVRLKLNNSLNRGELLVLNWKRLQASTQTLQSQFVFPYLLKSPFGLDIHFNMYKKDTTYLEVNPNIGIQYHLSGENYFKAFVNRKQLTLLSTKALEHSSVLPPYADISSTLYGLSIKSEKLDYRLNPRKGYSFIGTVGAGNKIIKKNPKLDATIYKGLKLNSVQYSAEIDAELFIPIKNRSTIKIGNKSAYLQNEKIFQNELFRIGGLKTLRGFDEESILASSYYIFTLEYRYLLEENSYLFFFGDGAYYENKSISFSGDRYDTPYGFGAGISFETKAGIFSVNYALGSRFNNPIDLRTGKVHFGIVNYF